MAALGRGARGQGVVAPTEAAERGRPAAAADLEDADAADAAEGGLRPAAGQPRQPAQERGHACARPTPPHSRARLAYREAQRRLRASASGVDALLSLPIARAICLCSASFRLAVVLSVRLCSCFCLPHCPSICGDAPLTGPRQARASPPGRAEVVPELDRTTLHLGLRARTAVLNLVLEYK
jgi:hypothetical protein